MSVHDRAFEPLPPHSDPRVALRSALPALRPAERVSVTEAAERAMQVNVAGQWQPFRREVTPYMVEPTDMIASREYRGLVFCGPSQSGKTQMLGAALAYTIVANPGRVALFQMTRDAAVEYERNKLSPMVRNSPEIRARVAKGRGADNLYQKLFTGGTQLTLDWPTITKLSSATIRTVLGTDYDHFPESIDGEGDAFSLMMARTRTFGSRGMVAVESSPGAPIIDETWRPRSPHDAPPVRYGVLSIYPRGTRGRWYWSCPHCAEQFEPRFSRLRWPDSADPAEAGAAAEMECPHCHALIGHHLKRGLNMAGRWLHETASGTVAPLERGVTRGTDVLSYWLDGAAASFATWSELVQGYVAALRHFEATGDEEPLKTAMNTGQAQPFLPRSASVESEITVQGLKDKARGVETPKRVAPEWARYLTVSVDVQGTRFVVGVTAWGLNGRHQPIDRFDLASPPQTAPDAADRTVKPFDIAEDWAVLSALTGLLYPVEGQPWRLRPMAVAVDMQGGGATTENAYAFYRARRKAGEGGLWYLTRGRGGSHSDRVWQETPERISARARRGRRVATDIKIVNMATDRLKDAVAASLRMTEDGFYLCVVPEWMRDDELTELTAERRGAKGWEKRPGMVRNESWDHLVQARALHILLGGEKITEAAIPAWALLTDANPFAVPIRSDSAVPDADNKKTAAPAAPARDAGWINPRPGRWL